MVGGGLMRPKRAGGVGDDAPVGAGARRASGKRAKQPGSSGKQVLFSGSTKDD